MERKRQHRRSVACPKYMVSNCPPLYLNDAEKYRRIDADYTVEKLRQLVSDPVTNDHVTRISRLLSNYLCEIGDDGYVSFNPHILKMKISLIENYWNSLIYMIK